MTPLKPPSVEPIESVMIRSGKRSRKRSLTDWEKRAALELTEIRLEASQRPASASSASIIGRATASPVMITELMPWASTRSHTPSASNLDTSTIVEPMNHWLSMAICAAPCMSGGITPKISGVSDAAAISALVNSEETRSLVSASMPWPRAKKMSSWRHITPLGIPVVPPV